MYAISMHELASIRSVSTAVFLIKSQTYPLQCFADGLDEREVYDAGSELILLHTIEILDVSALALSLTRKGKKCHYSHKMSGPQRPL